MDFKAFASVNSFSENKTPSNDKTQQSGALVSALDKPAIPSSVMPVDDQPLPLSTEWDEIYTHTCGHIARQILSSTLFKNTANDLPLPPLLKSSPSESHPSDPIAATENTIPLDPVAANTTNEADSISQANSLRKKRCLNSLIPSKLM